LHPTTAARLPTLLATAVCAALVVAGCGSSDDPDEAATPGDPTVAPCPSGLSKTGEICIDDDDPQASRIVEAVRAQFRPGVMSGVTFGVWQGDKAVATGALGDAQSGVPATRDMHVRIGNVVEALLTTQLLKLVEQGDVALDDPVSTWFPELPNADRVTLSMLAHSTSGYNDFVTSPAFVAALDKDPFQIWDVQELIKYGMSKDPFFEPGASWALSDTNFVLLGAILEKVAGRSLLEQLQPIFDELGMENTTLSQTSAIASPVLHSYTNERGPFEDATFWSTSWEPDAGNGTSNLHDMAVWAKALGERTVLTPESHELQLAPETAGLGPLTAAFYDGMGVIVGDGWVGSNRQINGYSAIVAYHPAKQITVVVFSTMGPQGDIADAYSTSIYDEITKVVTPGDMLPISALPRGPSGDK
jgi:D-alanyl-D-alanine carboxypeptidase